MYRFYENIPSHSRRFQFAFMLCRALLSYFLTTYIKMWQDVRTLPKVVLNCSLIKMWLEETEDEEPEDEYVEQLTSKMSRYIEIQLNLGKTVSVSEAFQHCVY